MRFFVVCDDVSEGFRPSEAQVAVRSLKGERHYLRLSARNLHDQASRKYLEIGVIHQDPETRAFLIEFPHEPDSGANRIWVPESSMLIETGDRVPA
jgi:hypothetical protein